MDYQVTARKWRPQSFEQIIGQESLVQAIKNAINSGRIPHAYLFSGVRGVGKTTTARVIAKALNCQNPSGLEPCNKCPSCLEITGGYSMDVIEIDGASNRGIDNIRQIRDTVTYMPLSGKYKIYIIDEVHMLTNEASNALLKTLEEPPEHVIFILATTESHKVLPTIKSRCQHYVFKKISAKLILTQLKRICESEKIQYSDEGLFLIASAADGSMRDAESVFDQVVLYSGGDITEENVAKLIGIPDMAYYTRILQAVIQGDAIAMLRALQDYMDIIGDIKLFTRGLIGFLKNGLLIKKLQPDDELLDTTESKFQQYKLLFDGLSGDEILRMMNLLIGMYRELKGDAQERFLLDITLFKLLDYKNIIPLSDLRNEILAFISKSGPVAAAVSPQPQSAQTIQAAQPGAAQSVHAVKLPQQSFQPPQKEVQKSADTAPSVNPINTGSSESSAREALLKVMSANPVMKPMVSAIKSVRFQNGILDVELSTAHTCEFLSKKKKDLQEGVSKILNSPVEIRFGHESKACENGSELPGAPEQTPIFTKPAEITKTPPVSEKPSEKKTDSPLVDTIVNLFDGKVE